MKITLAQIKRLLKFALSRKTRNRSRAQKEAWARRKGNAAMLAGFNAAMNAAENTTARAGDTSVPAIVSPALAVPDATRIKCRHCGNKVYPEQECWNYSMAQKCERNTASLDHLGAIHADKTFSPKKYGDDPIFTGRDGVLRVRKQEE